jgi:predicted NUDIX family NTP pyrophosphohydrolase
MAKISAGLLLYRRCGQALEILLVHPGGPFWAKKDLGAWSIVKGEAAPGEDLLACAKREFAEETGCLAEGSFRPLAPIRQAGGKEVRAWAVEMACDVSTIRSNLFEMEWPPRSGRRQSFPEIDRAEWFDPATARQKINKGQVPLIDELERVLADG